MVDVASGQVNSPAPRIPEGFVPTNTDGTDGNTGVADGAVAVLNAVAVPIIPHAITECDLVNGPGVSLQQCEGRCKIHRLVY